MIVQQAGEGVEHEEPRLHPQVTEGGLCQAGVALGGDEAPVVQAAVEGVEEVEDLVGGE